MKISEEELAQKVRKVQKELSALAIGYWRIIAVNIVEETPSGTGADATVSPNSLYDTCEFWFTRRFLESCEDDEELSHTIVHEWIHVAMRGLDVAIESIEDQLPAAACAVWSERIDYERESLVNRLATHLTDLRT